MMVVDGEKSQRRDSLSLICHVIICFADYNADESCFVVFVPIFSFFLQ